MSQHDELAKEFTVGLADSLEIVSGETKCITEGTVMESFDTGVERLSEGTVEGLEMSEVDTEDADLGIETVDMDRRWVDFKEYAKDVAVKKADLVRSAIQPNASFVQVQVSAINRLADKTLIDAAAATAYSGKTGTTTNALVAGSTIAHASVGFTVSKANDVIERLKTRGVVNDGEIINCLWNARMEKTFKMTAEVASNLYSNAMVIDKGYVTQWGPLRFYRIEDFIKRGSVVRRMLPWTADGVSAGINVRKAIFYPKMAFRRWRPLTASGVVTWEQRKRRFVISADSYVGAARRRDDAVMLMECAETDS